MAWRLRATRLAMGGAAGIVSASVANCHTATQTDGGASKLKSTLSSGTQKINVAPDHMLFAIPKKARGGPLTLTSHLSPSLHYPLPSP